MLYTELKNIYERNEFLASEFQFEEYYPLLQNFISKEVKLGAKYINPYRFSYDYTVNLDSVLKLFLAVSGEESIFRLRYKFQCDECDTINILGSIDLQNDQSICTCCSEEISISDFQSTNDVTLLFELSKSIILFLEQEQASKKSPSFNEAANSKEGELTLSRAVELLNENEGSLNPELKSELERIERYSKIVYESKKGN